MKKRVLAGIMMAVMVMASVMGVSAAESKTNEVYPSGTSNDAYVTDATFEGLDAEVKSEVEAIITELNAGKTTSLSTDIQKTLSGKTLVADVFDLQPVGDHEACKTQGHKVQLTVTSLTENCKNVVILHYSEDRNVWETIEPTSVDYANKTITAIFKDCSPVAIYADVTTGSGSTGTSPSTGVASSTWLICLAVAVVAVGVVTLKKSRS